MLELKATAYENDRERLMAKIETMVPTFNHKAALNLMKAMKEFRKVSVEATK